ncbi:hypothetical protein [Aliikangiella coralliicola]|uniref:DUF5666 domain-containing protein n=1 Tax=Aliikangiella coralliicola TaxID=2592383 RepID=A0A545UEN5_9GAMM|nr:hypothetical protein [Aliikangiella coralliicola]TQV87937.1 hypothetical protein FLL46_11200 [Aliikangiella coralliicola]
MSSEQNIKRRLAGYFCAILFSQCLLISNPMAATKKLNNLNNQGYNIEAMVSPSQQIVVGKVSSLSSRWVGNIIVTTANIEPLETIKGKATRGQLKVSYVGGTVGVIRQTLSHQTTLEEGETAILFLSDAPKKSALSGSKVFSHASGKIQLLKKGESISRLQSNGRLSKLLGNFRQQAKINR